SSAAGLELRDVLRAPGLLPGHKLFPSPLENLARRWPRLFTAAGDAPGEFLHLLRAELLLHPPEEGHAARIGVRLRHRAVDGVDSRGPLIEQVKEGFIPRRVGRQALGQPDLLDSAADDV